MHHVIMLEGKTWCRNPIICGVVMHYLETSSAVSQVLVDKLSARQWCLALYI